MQWILESLHREGVLASRVAGRTRLVTLNPRYFAAKPLRTLLWDLAKHDLPLQEKLAAKTGPNPSAEPAWMQGFGKLRQLATETRRIQARVDGAFEVVEPEDKE